MTLSKSVVLFFLFLIIYASCKNQSSHIVYNRDVKINENNFPLSLQYSFLNEKIFSINDSLLALITTHKVLIINYQNGEILNEFALSKEFVRKLEMILKPYFSNQNIPTTSLKGKFFLISGNSKKLFLIVSVLNSNNKQEPFSYFLLKLNPQNMKIEQTTYLPLRKLHNKGLVGFNQTDFTVIGDTLLYLPGIFLKNEGKEKYEFVVYHIKKDSVCSVSFSKQKMGREHQPQNYPFVMNNYLHFSHPIYSTSNVYYDGYSFVDLMYNKKYNFLLDSFESPKSFFYSNNILVCATMNRWKYYIKEFNKINPSQKICVGSVDSIKGSVVSKNNLIFILLKNDNYYFRIYKILNHNEK